MELGQRRERHPEVLALLERKKSWKKKPSNELHKDSHIFTAEADHFKKYGVYTKHPYSKNPQSPYYKYWVEQARRSIHGYSKGDDWITGYHYFFLNFCPIMIADGDNADTDVLFEEEIQSIQADRITDFPKFYDVQYDYFHYLEEAEFGKLVDGQYVGGGKHGTVLKSRNKGVSFIGGGMANRNYTLIPGSKTYIFADKKQYLEEDGILTKAWDIMAFIDEHTGWGRRRSINRMYHKRSAFTVTINGKKIEKGYRSEIIGVPFNGDYNKARGKRGKLILYEEAGDFTKLLEAWNVSLNLMKSGRKSFGMQIAFGTGGTIGAGFLGLQSLFYKPNGYNVHSVDNTWDKVAAGTQSGFFIPIYKGLDGYMDINGNSLVAKAVEYLLKEREYKKSNVKNRDDFLRYKAEEPFTPQEAVIRVGGSMFPIEDLTEHLNKLLMDSKLKDSAKYGYFALGDEEDEYEFKPGGTKVPIDEFPILNKEEVDLSGAIVIWEAPVRDKNGNVPFGRYLAGNDPYDHDDASTTSLGSTFIMDKVTRRIVAEYTGRPPTANLFYENTRRLILFYNAMLNYENNLPGLKSYFENKHTSYMLSDTPECIKDKVADLVILRRGKGTPATERINKFGRELILSWLMEPIARDSEKRRLTEIKSIPLLQELISWNKDLNCDRVSALGMLMILDEDMRLQDPENETTAKDIADEDVWDRMFND